MHLNIHCCLWFRQRPRNNLLPCTMLRAGPPLAFFSVCGALTFHMMSSETWPPQRHKLWISYGNPVLKRLRPWFSSGLLHSRKTDSFLLLSHFLNSNWSQWSNICPHRGTCSLEWDKYCQPRTILGQENSTCERQELLLCVMVLIETGPMCAWKLRNLSGCDSHIACNLAL